MKRIGILLTAILLSAGLQAAAGTTTGQPSHSQQTFFNRFRTAVLGENTAQIIELTHPASLQCVPREDRRVYYSRIMDGLVRILGHSQTLKSLRIKPVGKDELRQITAVHAQMTWPVKPDEKMIVTFEKKGRENVTNLYIARDRDEWKWVHACAGH